MHILITINKYNINPVSHSCPGLHYQPHVPAPPGRQITRSRARAPAAVGTWALPPGTGPVSHNTNCRRLLRMIIQPIKYLFIYLILNLTSVRFLDMMARPRLLTSSMATARLLMLLFICNSQRPVSWLSYTSGRWWLHIHCTITLALYTFLTNN